jgi:aryl-alcohol dehydrogenase-like predicted oxidoreductase
MRYRLLGRSSLRVTELCLAPTVFGDTRGPWGTTPEDAHELLNRFNEAGGNFIDTMNLCPCGLHSDAPRAPA